MTIHVLETSPFHLLLLLDDSRHRIGLAVDVHTVSSAQCRSNEGCSSPRGEWCVDVDEWQGGRTEKRGEMGY